MKKVARVDSSRRISLFGLILFLLLISLNSQRVVSAQSNDPDKILLYYFWRYDCSHCIEAKPFLTEIQERYPQVEIQSYEIHDRQNFNLLMRMANERNIPEEKLGTPAFIFLDHYWIGYSEQINQAIEVYLQEKTSKETASILNIENKEQIIVPIIGTIDLSSQSIVVSTILISFVDGFNPCSIWVLTMLLALTLHTGSRQRVLFIGLIFLTITAVIYGLFITGLFAVLSIISFVGWIKIVVALFTLFFALVNIKDYFWYKEGISFTIPDDRKPSLFKRIRKVVDTSQSIWGLAGATILIAGGVSLIEFSCTAGFPVLWTNLLTTHQVSPLTFSLLLLLYLIIYQLDELAIFLTAVISLQASRLEEKQGRILKLIGGMLMLTLAVVMIVNPTLMNHLSSSLIVFAIAFCLCILLLLLHRKVLPHFGIWIGTEARNRKKISRHVKRTQH